MFDYQAPPGLLGGRNILVTGAGDGIGRAAALAFAQHGAHVVLVGRTAQKLEAVYDEIEATGGPRPALCALDFAAMDAGQCSELAAMIEDEFGVLHGLLHNAGMLGSLSPVASYEPSKWQQVMQVNVHAAFLLTQAMIPLLSAADDASVVFTSSGVGRRGRAHWGAYAVSKFAVEGMMQVLADELFDLHGIRCNSVNPGATRTSMRARAFPGEHPGNNPAPADILPVYLYLMGPDSRSVNGQALDAKTGRPSPP